MAIPYLPINQKIGFALIRYSILRFYTPAKGIPAAYFVRCWRHRPPG